MNSPRHDWNELLFGQVDWLRSVVRSRLRESQHVDDIVQDVMADALAAKVDPDQIRTIRPWLYRLALRKVLLFRRSAGRKRRAYAGVAKQEPLEPSPLELILGKERQHLIRKSIGRLASKDIEILNFKYVQNWSYETISNNLGISTSKVTHRLRVARSRLKSELRNLLDEEELQ